MTQAQLFPEVRCPACWQGDNHSCTDPHANATCSCHRDGRAYAKLRHEREMRRIAETAPWAPPVRIMKGIFDIGIWFDPRKVAGDWAVFLAGGVWMRVEEATGEIVEFDIHQS